MTPPRLVSDFHDYYDHELAGSFAAAPRVLHRVSTSGPRRHEQHELLDAAGFRVPARGSAGALRERGFVPRAGLVVGYTDVHAHRGEGKVRCGLDALSRATYCCEFVPPRRRSESVRALAVGGEHVLMVYRSKDSWRSNVGDVEITALDDPALLREVAPRLRALDFPLVAVDMIDAADGSGWWAVDLNTAPGLKGSPAQERWPARRVAELLGEWFERRGG